MQTEKLTQGIPPMIARLTGDQQKALLAACKWSGDPAHLPALRDLARKGLLALCSITHEGATRKAAVLTTSGLAVRTHLEQPE